jgi:hypothetical protein
LNAPEGYIPQLTGVPPPDGTLQSAETYGAPGVK